MFTIGLVAYMECPSAQCVLQNDSFPMVMDKCDIPEGAINGLFSINQWKTVFFSKGNLQYQTSNGIWGFAENQHDYLGCKNWLNNSMIDLFECPKRLGYNSIIDWGDNQIINGGSRRRLWRTLTWEEWWYVFYNRNTKSGLLYAKAEVRGINGVILFPDDWENTLFDIHQANMTQASFKSNIIADGVWSLMEESGAVFLPCAGYRGGNSYYGFGSYGGYWSSSLFSEGSAYALHFDDSNLDISSLRYSGVSVRLVYAKDFVYK